MDIIDEVNQESSQLTPHHKSTKSVELREEEKPPTLGYWKIRGRGQAIRYQLWYIGVNYNDMHYSHNEDDVSTQQWLEYNH